MNAATSTCGQPSCVRGRRWGPGFPHARRRDSMPAERDPGTAMTTQTIIVERRGRVGIVRLNRPQALNALNATLRNELLGAVEAFDADAGVGCILLTGSEKAFAAGAEELVPQGGVERIERLRPVEA